MDKWAYRQIVSRKLEQDSGRKSGREHSQQIACITVFDETTAERIKKEKGETKRNQPND